MKRWVYEVDFSVTFAVSPGSMIDHDYPMRVLFAAHSYAEVAAVAERYVGGVWPNVFPEPGKAGKHRRTKSVTEIRCLGELFDVEVTAS